MSCTQNCDLSRNETKRKADAAEAVLADHKEDVPKLKQDVEVLASVMEVGPLVHTCTFYFANFHSIHIEIMAI